MNLFIIFYILIIDLILDITPWNRNPFDVPTPAPIDIELNMEPLGTKKHTIQENSDDDAEKGYPEFSMKKKPKNIESSESENNEVTDSEEDEAKFSEINWTEHSSSEVTENSLLGMILY